MLSLNHLLCQKYGKAKSNQPIPGLDTFLDLHLDWDKTHHQTKTCRTLIRSPASSLPLASFQVQVLALTQIKALDPVITKPLGKQLLVLKSRETINK